MLRGAVLSGLAIAAAFLVAGLVRAAGGPVDNTTLEDSTDTSGAGAIDQAAAALDGGNPFSTMDANTIAADQADTNCTAFLQTIAVSEGTAGQADPYRVCFGNRHVIRSFADHPAITGEWPGEPLDSLGPQYAGKISTAAGKYQIIRPTWRGCKAALNLPDFSPDSQDKAALYIVREAGALDLVKAGQFDQAVALCAKQWASLPGANVAGQGMARLADLEQAYTNAGGDLA